MAEIHKSRCSYQLNDNYINNLGSLPPNEQADIISAMFTERFFCRPFYDSDNNQTYIFAGKTIINGQVNPNIRYILGGCHEFPYLQIITGCSLPEVRGFDLYFDD